MQVHLDHLAIEVTRKCNMSCPHCMRGDSCNLDQTKENIDLLLKNVNSISSLTFTGGEPTLNVEIIKYTLNECKKNNIEVDNFYVVTNGKQITDLFLKTMIEWYVYCIKNNGEYELCGLALSKDKYHEKIPEENEAILRSLSFFCEDKFTDWNKYSLVDIGRAKSIDGYKRKGCKEEFDWELMDNIFYINSTIALTCAGNIISGCDYAYDDEKDYVICRLDDFENYLKSLVTYDENTGLYNYKINFGGKIC